METMNRIDNECQLSPEYFETMLAWLNVSYSDNVLVVGQGKLLEETLQQLSIYINSGKRITVIEADSEGFKNRVDTPAVPVVHDDFSTFDTLHRYDRILLNPPPGQGETYLVKALDLLKPGGTCVCLLPENVVRFPVTDLRKNLVRRLREWNYEKTIVSETAKNTENTGKTENRRVIINESIVKHGYAPQKHIGGTRNQNIPDRIALLKVTRPDETESVGVLRDMIVANGRKYAEQVTQDTRLAEYPEIPDLIVRCRMDQEAGILLYQEREALTPFLLDYIPNDGNTTYYKYCQFLRLGEEPNEYLKNILGKYWVYLATRSVMSDLLPSSIREAIRREASEWNRHDFTVTNIIKALRKWRQALLDKVKDGMFDVLKTLSEMSYYRNEPEDDNDNVQFFRGWENKKAWKIKPNLVLGWKALQKESYSNHNRLDNNVQDKLESMEKMLDLLTGDFTPGPSISACATAIQNGGTSRNIQLKHSCVSFFTKKTTIDFLNPAVVHKLNIFVAQHQKWLPPGYGKTPYENLSKTGRSVVDSFEGEASYRETCKKNDLFSDQVESLPLFSFNVTENRESAT